MESINNWDRRQNRGKVTVGSEWYLRHSKRFRVKVTSVRGNVVKYTAQRGKLERTQTFYGFLSIYRPWEVER